MDLPVSSFPVSGDNEEVAGMQGKLTGFGFARARRARTYLNMPWVGYVMPPPKTIYDWMPEERRGPVDTIVNAWKRKTNA